MYNIFFQGVSEKDMKPERLASLDAFRGFDILVMTFVNYIAGMAAVPFILRHAPADMDAFTLTDVVFPGFLFILGVAIPLSLQKRIVQGDSLGRILNRQPCLPFHKRPPCRSRGRDEFYDRSLHRRKTRRPKFPGAC